MSRDMLEMKKDDVTTKREPKIKKQNWFLVEIRKRDGKQRRISAVKRERSDVEALKRIILLATKNKESILVVKNTLYDQRDLQACDRLTWK